MWAGLCGAGGRSHRSTGEVSFPHPFVGVGLPPFSLFYRSSRSAFGVPIQASARQKVSHGRLKPLLPQQLRRKCQRDSPDGKVFPIGKPFVKTSIRRVADPSLGEVRKIVNLRERSGGSYFSVAPIGSLPSRVARACQIGKEMSPETVCTEPSMSDTFTTPVW